MYAVYRCVVFGLIFGCVTVSSLSDYAINFPSTGVTGNFVNIWGMPSLTQFTVCLWMKSSDTIKLGTPFSYAVPGSDNELLIYNYKSFHIWIKGSPKSTSVSANDGKWHHICTSWENTAGSWKFYRDGAVAAKGTGHKTAHVIKSGGSIVLGQEQDSPGGGFDANQSFIGMLTNVNVWDHVLPIAQIEQMSKSCLSGEGNVYKWSDFIHGREGNARVVIPSPCKPLSA